MMDYKNGYFILFHGITDAISSIRRNDDVAALRLLVRVQQEAEEAYIRAQKPAVLLRRVTKMP